MPTEISTIWGTLSHDDALAVRALIAINQFPFASQCAEDSLVGQGYGRTEAIYAVRVAQVHRLEIETSNNTRRALYGPSM